MNTTYKGATGTLFTAEKNLDCIVSKLMYFIYWQLDCDCALKIKRLNNGTTHEREKGT